MRFRSDTLAIAGAFVAAGVAQQDRVFSAAATQSLGDKADRDRGFLDIARIGVGRHQRVAVALASAVSGEKEPQFAARLQEFVFEPDPQKPSEGAPVGDDLIGSPKSVGIGGVSSAKK